MKLAVILAILLALAAPAAAQESVPNNDAEALAVYVIEYRAQDVALGEAIAAYFGSTSLQRATAGETLRAGIIASQDHMAELDVRLCYALLDEAVHAGYDALVRAFRPGISPALQGLEVAHFQGIGRVILDEQLDALGRCGVD